MRTTEKESRYNHLDTMDTGEILRGINTEDHTVPVAVGEAIPQIAQVVEQLVERVRQGGRIFYLGAGTSGRLGVVDASEIPPTYGVKGTFIGLIAGGDQAIRSAVEGAEDDWEGAWRDLAPFQPNPLDSVVGVAASGTTPYVIGGVRQARAQGLFTSCITCNPGAPLAEACEAPIVVEVGPEFVTGSTRMKAGTAQKLVLNMISTAVMIRLGHVKGNKMVDMELTNRKLVDRGTRMIMEATGLQDYEKARGMLLTHGHVREAVEAWFTEHLPLSAK